MQRVFISGKDVQKMLGISHVAIHYMRRDGRLPFIKTEDGYLHDLAAVEALAAERRERLQQKLARMGAIA